MLSVTLMRSSRCINSYSLVAFTNNITSHLGFTRSYTKYQGPPCKDTPETQGNIVESWSKCEKASTAWRQECPCGPQPPNYDPYRIKVPDVAVPPLPPSDAKPMLECAKIKGPCAPTNVPPPPPCPPRPSPPFPWMYVWALLSFFSIMGLLYRTYLYIEEKERLGENKPVWQPRRKVKHPAHATDLPPCVQYLIIGSGAAAWAAYRSIMEHDKKAKVFFITKEDSLPYIRPPMSKHMWWNKEPPDVKSLEYVEDLKKYSMYYADCKHFMDPSKFYRIKSGPAVSIASGWCVLRVDADDHVVYVKTNAGEQPIYYERCLLAPGSKAKTLQILKTAPKAVRERVTTLRTIRDLEVAYRKVKAAKHVTIIGGGILGSELAWHLGKMNEVVEQNEDEEPTKFVHIFKDKGVMSGILPEYLGEWTAEKIRNVGVTIVPKAQVYDAFLSKDGKLELTLSDGSSIITDYAFVAIGADPRVELAKPSFLERDMVNGGFLVNTELKARTHLYVAGDAASFYSQWKDTRLRCEHHGNAAEQGALAGANMTGYWTPCNMEPHFQVKLGDFEFEAVGEIGACMPIIGIFKPCNEESKPQKARETGGGDHPCYKKSEEYQNRYKRGLLFYLRDETIVGMIFWNMPPIDDRVAVATEILRAQPSYTDINLIAEMLGFPEAQCEYVKPEERVESSPCISKCHGVSDGEPVLAFYELPGTKAEGLFRKGAWTNMEKNESNDND